KAGNAGEDSGNAGKLTYTDNKAPVVDIIGSEVVEGQEATIKAFISKVQFKDLTITLSNGAIIIIEAGKLEGSVNIQTQRVDDAYKQGETTEKVFISSTSNPDINIVGKEATIKISDDSDVTTVKITAAETTEKVITIDNLQNNQGFTVTAKDPYGAAATISTHTDPAGFGVLSNAEKPYIGQTDAIYSGHTSEIGVVKDKQTGKYLSETIEVEFKNPIQTLDVSFSWRDSKETARVDFYNGDKKVGYAVISGGGTNTSATIKYYDEKGILKSSVSVQGGTDAVDSVYTFKPAGDVTFTKAVFSAEGAGSDYLINSITYKEVVDGQNTTIVGSNEVAFKIETSNIPDPSKYDFKTTFPTAHVKIVDGSNNIVFEGDVNLDKDGKAIVSVRTDGTKDLTATVSDVQGNFEKVDYSDAFTTIVSSLSPQAGNDSITILEDTSYTLKSTDFGDNNQNVAKIKFTEVPENGKVYILKTEITSSINDRAEYKNESGKVYVEIKAGDIVDISTINNGNLVFVPNKDTDDDSSFKFSVSNGNGNFSENYTTTINITAVADAPVVSINITKVGETTIAVAEIGSDTNIGVVKPTIPTNWWSGYNSKEDIIQSATYEKDVVDWNNNKGFLSGDDSVSVKTLNASIDTGSGNDNIYISGNVNQSISTGSGDDKVFIEGTVSSASWTIDLGEGNNYLHAKKNVGIVTGYSGDDIVLVGGNTTGAINLGDGNNELQIKGNAENVIITGSGNDKVIVEGYTGNVVNLGDGDNELYIKGNAGNKIITGSGNDKVIVEGYTGNVVNLGDGDNELYIKGNAGNKIITGSGNDRVIIEGNVGNNISLGAGDDYLEIGGTFTNLDGGEGIDSLYLKDYTIAQVTAIMKNQSWRITNFENIKCSDGMYKGDASAFESSIKAYEYKVDISASLTDRDGSETLTVIIKNVPETATLESSKYEVIKNSDGSYTVTVPSGTLDISDSLTMKVPQSYKGDINLQIEAKATESSNSDTATSIANDKIIVNETVTTIDETSNITVNKDEETNLILTVDVSGSMATYGADAIIDKEKGITRLDVVKQSLISLIETYKAAGNTMVNITLFANKALNKGWMSADEAIKYINSLSMKGFYIYEGDTKISSSKLYGDSTDYAKALEETGKVDISKSGQADAKTVAYFISDGQPQTSSQKKAVDSDSDTAIVNWKTFIENNNIDLKVIGVGTAENNADALKYLKFVQVMPGDEVITINEPTAIETTILGTVEGTVFGDISDNFSGGDGKVTIDSIKVGDTIYTKDTMPAGGIKLEGEGKLLFDFTTGKYAYNGNGIDITEDKTKSFEVNVSDEDGDKATINVSFELNKNQIEDGVISFKEDGDINFSNLKNITEINLDNGEENKLSLTLKDVLDIGKKDGDGKINLTILGDDKDTVSFKDTVKEDGSKNAWSKTEGTGTDKGYDIYINSGDPTVQVKVEHPISDGITH
ncbi:hypothetical protein N5U06_09105, partial [Aliarcobacter butzleri]|uniref:immunoglobulin-like domain-containing protein n=1 Tax=Aliarcobacter butzleri TaxID=28197 RepID=UPI0028CB3C74